MREKVVNGELGTRDIDQKQCQQYTPMEPETIEHILMECSAYDQAKSALVEKIECLNHSFPTKKALLGPWSSPSSHRKVLAALFDYLHYVGVVDTI